MRGIHEKSMPINNNQGHQYILDIRKHRITGPIKGIQAKLGIESRAFFAIALNANAE